MKDRRWKLTENFRECDHFQIYGRSDFIFDNHVFAESFVSLNFHWFDDPKNELYDLENAVYQTILDFLNQDDLQKAHENVLKDNPMNRDGPYLKINFVKFYVIQKIMTDWLGYENPVFIEIEPDPKKLRDIYEPFEIQNIENL